jgi:hypothetical protein
MRNPFVTARLPMPNRSVTAKEIKVALVAAMSDDLLATRRWRWRWRWAFCAEHIDPIGGTLSPP